MISDLWLFGADAAAPSEAKKAPEVLPIPGINLDLFGGSSKPTPSKVTTGREFLLKCDELAVMLTKIAENKALSSYALRLRSMVWEIEEAYSEGRLEEARAELRDEAKQIASYLAGIEGDPLLRLVCRTWPDAEVHAAIV